LLFNLEKLKTGRMDFSHGFNAGDGEGIKLEEKKRL
jgi:hypothetical protein